MRCLSILVVDDHAVLRDGLTLLLNAQPDLCVVGHAADAQTALEQARKLRPDVVLLDLVMPGPSGLEVARQLKAELPDTRVIALTMHEDESYLIRSLQAGAEGFVLKRSPTELLLKTIREVAAGQRRFDVAFFTPRASLPEVSGEFEAPAVSLDERERQVLRMLAWGYGAREIAQRLRLQAKTVAACRHRIVAKLALNSRVDLVRYALKHGLLNEPPAV